MCDVYVLAGGGEVWVWVWLLVWVLYDVYLLVHGVVPLTSIHVAGGEPRQVYLWTIFVLIEDI